MLPILLCTILGFLAGLIYVMKIRRIRPGKILAATFVALLAGAIFKGFRDHYSHYYKKGRWQ